MTKPANVSNKPTSVIDEPATRNEHGGVELQFPANVIDNPATREGTVLISTV